LYHDINRMAGLAYPGKSSIHRELASIDTFIDALNDSNLRMRVRDKEPKNLDHALHIALIAEANRSRRRTPQQIIRPLGARSTKREECRIRVMLATVPPILVLRV